jgi:peptidoglycan/LPS O-acetylase OafA/YrhL
VITAGLIPKEQPKENMHALGPRPRNTHYLPTLDGWRTLAILGVMLCHDSLHRLGPLNTGWLHDHGNVGVDIFFAISGILICSRLLSEEKAWGRISLRRFYLRRAFRILPAAAVFLATLLILKAAVHLPVEVPEVIASLFFFRNYTSLFSHWQTAYPYYTSHFWSLAVEEHFYLILPGLLVLSGRRFRAPLLFILAMAVSLHRIAPHSWLSLHSDMRLDALLVAAGFAVLLQAPGYRQRLLPGLRFAPVFAPIFAAVLLALLSSGLYPRTTGLLIAWLMPFLILATVLNPRSWFGGFLESAPLRYVGRISYSLYLWQQLFLLSHFGAGSARLGIVQSWPYNWIATFACALASFYLVEQPLIRLGRRLAQNAPTDRLDTIEKEDEFDYQ